MSSDYGGRVLEDFYSGTKKSNTVRNLLIVSSLLLLCGLVGIGAYIAIVSGVSSISSIASDLFTLGGAFPDFAIAANALAILLAICITIALGIAINKQINSKTLKALVNFVLTLALGMGTVALLAFMFGITVPNLFAGFADLAAVFSQGASAQAILTGIILAISLISLVVAFVTYKSGGDDLTEGERNLLEEFSVGSSAPDLTKERSKAFDSPNEEKQITFHYYNGAREYSANYKITRFSNGMFQYTLVGVNPNNLPTEFYSTNSELSHVNLNDANDSSKYVNTYVEETPRKKQEGYQDSPGPGSPSQ